MSQDEVYAVRATSVRDYVNNLRSYGYVFGWIRSKIFTMETRKWALWMLVSMSISMICHTLVPIFIGNVIDSFNAENLNHYIAYLVGGALMFVLMDVTGTIQKVCRELVFRSNFIQMDKTTNSLFFSKSINQYLRESTGLNSATVNRGRSRINDLAFLILFEALSSLLSLLFSYGFITFVISPTAGLLLLPAILISIVHMMYLNQRVIEICGPLDKEWQKHGKYRTNRYDNAEHVILNGRVDDELGFMTKWLQEILDKDTSFWIKYSISSSVRDVFFLIFGVCVVIGLHAYWAWQGAFLIGSLVSLIGLTVEIRNKMWRIGQVEHRVNWNMPSVLNMIEELEKEQEVKVVDNAVKINPKEPLHWVFENVNYGHTPEVQVLYDVSFEIPPGKVLGILGESGAGKSTIKKLVHRYDDPWSGRILLNGRDLREYDLNSIRNVIGDIPQRPPIFDDTLRANIKYALPFSEHGSLTDEEVWSMASRFSINFKSREEGLDLRVGPNGTRLSGGEGQRIVALRAMLKNPLFLTIDEGTNSLDAVTEAKIQELLSELLEKGNMGGLVIAHRLNTLDICDMFLVMRDHRKVGEGESSVETFARTRDELKHSAIYSEFAHIQKFNEVF